MAPDRRDERFSTDLASYLSIVNSASEFIGAGKLGFFNPTLYSLSGGNPTSVLYDVVDGTNGDLANYGTAGFFAGVGYDNCTGAGTIWGPGFAYAELTSGTSGTPPGQVTGLTAKNITKSSAELTWNAASGATGYVVSAVYNVPGYPYTKALTYVLSSSITKLELKQLLPSTTYTPYVSAGIAAARHRPACRTASRPNDQQIR
jgi:kumamolisin